ncbi:hypothetical protein [Streptomyces sp. PA5.6]|uniref:hypothetical protein n=1 Tax=Streptomyces sp. PA5.6 TaxID=3035651 RepID=UPI0039048BC7
MAQDLATLAEAGLDATEATRTALSWLAGCYRWAWRLGSCPRGVIPVMRAVYKPYAGPRQGV